MLLREEFRERLLKEYNYAANKMQETPNPVRKIFYFSVFFGEAQRVLNWEWKTDLALIYVVTRHVHTQLNGSWSDYIKQPELMPIDWNAIFAKLTQVASDLTAYIEKGKDNKEELCTIMGQFAEVEYSVSGNGSYLYEKGAFTL